MTLQFWFGLVAGLMIGGSLGVIAMALLIANRLHLVREREAYEAEVRG